MAGHQGGLLVTLLCVSVVSCSSEETGGGGGAGGGGLAPATYALDGFAQKGPFINGATITVGELDGSLVPTGRTFSTTIADDSGAFSLPNVELSSQYVQLSADGFYFDEVGGELSAAAIKLHALADVTNTTSINVNLMSHLERPRVEFLIGEGMAFADAKAQAQAEILAVFEIEMPGMQESELLNIANGTDDDAVLLALSAILQGVHSPAELSELLAAMNTDLRTDGVLDSPSTGSELINEATLLDLASVRTNIEERYLDLGVSATIGNFEAYVEQFIDNTSFVFTKNIEYPATGEHGANILALDTLSYTGSTFSMAAAMPTGTSLTVVISVTSGELSGGDATDRGGWDFVDINQFPITAGSNAQFVALEPVVDTVLVFTPPGSADISYFENGASTAVRTKSIEWN